MLNDVSLSRIRPSMMAQEVAYLPQDRHVYWALSCRDIVSLGRIPYRLGTFTRGSVADEEAIDAAISQMRIQDFLGRVFETLSGGEQARVLVARVLAQETSIILADEPTNGLDPAHQNNLMRLFQTFVSNRQKTVLVSLHDLALASRWCDRIILLNEGRVVADGSPRDAMTSSILGDVYGVKTAQIEFGDGFLVAPVDLASHAKQIQ